MYRPDLIYYSSMIDEYTRKKEEQGPKVFNQNIDRLAERIDKIIDPVYRLLIQICHTTKGVRRMRDYYSLKINGYDKKTDNYITVGGRLVFNKYDS